MTTRYIAYWIPACCDIEKRTGVAEITDNEAIEIEGIGTVSMYRDELGFYAPRFPILGQSVPRDPYRMHLLGVMPDSPHAGLFNNHKDACTELACTIFKAIQNSQVK